MKTPTVLAVAVLLSTGVAESPAGQDVATLVSDAQRTYVRGDLAGAQEKFELVRRLEPQNRVAIGYLRRIIAERAREDAARGPANATKAALERIVLEKVQFEDATLPEVLDFLRQKGNQLGGGKVAINFVRKLDEKGQNARVTLSLSQVPFTEVLRYVGDLAGVDFKYERFAIVVVDKGAEPAKPAPAESRTIKIPGLDE